MSKRRNGASNIERTGQRNLTSADAMSVFTLMQRRIASREVALFLDYDGTLTPIVDDPATANLSHSMRFLLSKLASNHTLAIVSGRDLHDLEQRVCLDNIHYVGCHGFEIKRATTKVHPAALAALPALAAANAELRTSLAKVPGVIIESKKYGVSIHHRLVASNRVAQVAKSVESIANRHEGALRLRTGKKVLELLPDAEWNKGEAVRWLMDELRLGDAAVMYIGDDRTDEDAFRLLRGQDISIVVADHPVDTYANFCLSSPREVERLLKMIGEGDHLSPNV